MDCSVCASQHDSELAHKFNNLELELVGVAKRMLQTANDPFSAVIKFLAERPENSKLSGQLMNKVLMQTFEDPSKIPGLIKILAAHVREVCRKRNVIELINEHPAAEKWGNFIIKQKEQIKFEVGVERGKLVLSNISGLIAVEHGVELPLERILVQPPRLLVTVKLGILRPQKEVEL